MWLPCSSGPALKGADMLCTATQRPLTTVYVLTYRRQEEKAGRQRLAAALATGPGAFRDYLGSLASPGTRLFPLRGTRPLLEGARH